MKFGDLCPVTPSEKQLLFLKQSRREVFYGGAVGGGKSVALLMAALQGVHHPKYRALLIRRTFSDLNQPGALIDLSRQWLTGRARWSGQKRTWTFPTGATLSFGYCQHPGDIEQYQGASYWFIGFDEIGQFPVEPYTYMFSRLRSPVDRGGIPLRIRCAGNPGGIGHTWIRERFGIPEHPGSDPVEHCGRLFIPSRLDDNPGLDRAGYRSALAELDPLTRDQLENGSWVLDSSNHVWSCWHSELAVQSPPWAQDPTWTVLGIDYGVNDMTAHVVLQRSQYGGPVCAVWAEQCNQKSPAEVSHRTAQLVQQWKPDLIVGDSGGMGKAFITESRKMYGIPLQPAEKTEKLANIRLLNGAMSVGGLLVLSSLHELCTELTELRWADNRRLGPDQSQLDHLSDALLYGWRGIRDMQIRTRPVEAEDPMWEKTRQQLAAAKMNRQKLWGLR